MAPPPLPGVDVIVVAWNSAADLPTCLDALAAQTAPPRAVIVVDNASADDSAAVAAAHPLRPRVLRPGRNLGFGGGNNLGVRAGQAPIVAFVNPDVTLSPTWLERAAELLSAYPELGVVGGKFLFPDGVTVQHAGGVVRRPLALADHLGYGQPDDPAVDVPREVDYVTGAAIALPRAAFDLVGGFDEGFFPAYFEETDLCRRLRDVGRRVLYHPTLVAIHRESAALGRASARYFRHYHHGRLRYLLKHTAPDEFADAVAPSELARLAAVEDAAERLALHRAYATHLDLLRGPRSAWAAFRAAGDAPDLADARAWAALESLVAAARRLPRRYALGAPPIEPDADAPVAAALADLRARATPIEHEFRSAVPVVGRAIAAFRTAWNDVATRWYVRPIAARQAAFNHALVDVLAALHEDRRRRRDAARRARQETLIGAGWLAGIEEDALLLRRDLAAFAATRPDPPPTPRPSGGSPPTTGGTA